MAPAPLSTFFTALGTSGAVGVQDRLVAPSQWRLDAGKLRFAEENQCVCEWACDLAAVGEPDDPPVYYRHHRKSEWADEQIRLSAFLLRFTTVESVFGCEAAESAPCLPDATLALIVERMRILPFSAASWPTLPTRLFARGNALALVSPNGDGANSVWIGSDSRDDLDFIEDLLDGEWD